MTAALDVVATIGRVALDVCAAAGRILLFALSGLSHIFRPPFYAREFGRALLEIGFFSLPVVALTATFTGMVLALQASTGLSRFSAESAVANLVVLSVTRRLGPVVAGLMVAGRVGAGMAAVAPRLLAGVISLPLLVVVADVLGVAGGTLIATLKLGIDPQIYLTQTVHFTEWNDVLSGLAKAAVFGLLIVLMGCYNGYRSKGGAQGVGNATTSAVVAASVLILAFDYVLTELFFSR